MCPVDFYATVPFYLFVPNYDLQGSKHVAFYKAKYCSRPLHSLKLSSLQNTFSKTKALSMSDETGDSHSIHYKLRREGM